MWRVAAQCGSTSKVNSLSVTARLDDVLVKSRETAMTTRLGSVPDGSTGVLAIIAQRPSAHEILIRTTIGLGPCHYNGLVRCRRSQLSCGVQNRSDNYKQYEFCERK